MIYTHWPEVYKTFIFYLKKKKKVCACVFACVYVCEIVPKYKKHEMH